MRRKHCSRKKHSKRKSKKLSRRSRSKSKRRYESSSSSSGSSSSSDSDSDSSSPEKKKKKNKKKSKSARKEKKKNRHDERRHHRSSPLTLMDPMLPGGSHLLNGLESRHLSFSNRWRAPDKVAGRPNADAVAWEEYDRVHGSSHPNNAGTIMQRQIIPPAPAVPVVVAGHHAGGAAAAVGTGAGAIGAALANMN